VGSLRTIGRRQAGALRARRASSRPRLAVAVGVGRVRRSYGAARGGRPQRAARSRSPPSTADEPAGLAVHAERLAQRLVHERDGHPAEAGLRYQARCARPIRSVASVTRGWPGRARSARLVVDEQLAVAVVRSRAGP
jgi:hypothetical protein